MRCSADAMHTQPDILIFGRLRQYNYVYEFEYENDLHNCAIVDCNYKRFCRKQTHAHDVEVSDVYFSLWHVRGCVMRMSSAYFKFIPF